MRCERAGRREGGSGKNGPSKVDACSRWSVPLSFIKIFKKEIERKGEERET
jgi:hypothetical protein